MYDFSLLEKYSNVKYHIKVFNLQDAEHCQELSSLMEDVHKERNTKLTLRKDLHSEKTGQVLAHVEWVTYDKEKVSPFINDPKNKSIMINNIFG